MLISPIWTSSFNSSSQALLLRQLHEYFGKNSLGIKQGYRATLRVFNYFKIVSKLNLSILQNYYKKQYYKTFPNIHHDYFKTTLRLHGRWLSIKDFFGRRQPLMEDNIWEMVTVNGRQLLIEDNSQPWRNKTFKWKNL